MHRLKTELFSADYQWVAERVKPERDLNNRAIYRDNWWVFGEPRLVLRAQLKGLPRYIATVETAKHRVFQFLDINVLPDNKLVAIALDDALHLGVLSSRVHGAWALAAGSWLGVGNDPVYVKSRCFEAFPFPTPDTGLTPALSDRIRTLAGQIDSHRKARQAAHADATITGIYNVLDKLRSGEALTAKEQAIHQHGLVGVLQSLHDELDAAVLQAYGWADLAPGANHALDTDALLLRLVDLNTRRAAEEASGTVHWLRPAFQCATSLGTQAALEGTQDEDAGSDGDDADEATTAAASTRNSKGKPQGSGKRTSGKPANAQPGTATAPAVQRAWPTQVPEQIKAVAEVLSQTSQPLTLDALAQHFTARGRWRERLPGILDLLVALGRARVQGDGVWVDGGR